MTTKKLFVGSLPYSTTSEEVEKLFAEVGKVDNVSLIVDKSSGQSKGFAFVEMGNDKLAEDAIKKYNNYEMDGRRIVVNIAKPRTERPAF